MEVWLLKRLCQMNYTVEGLENIPKDRNGIILSKHQSIWETLFLPLIFNHPAVILKRELLWVPLTGWVLACVELIPIDRKNKMKARESILKFGQKNLDKGRWVLMFPEGTRIAPGNIGDYKLGGARLAAHTGYPILPVAHNAGHCWPRRKFIIRPGHVRVVIGPLIESKGKTPEILIAETKQWIENTMQRIENDRCMETLRYE